jgi:hypothetical protein
VLSSVAGIIGKLLNVAVGCGAGGGVAEEVDCCVYCASVARMAWRSGGCAMIEVRCVEESMLWRRRAMSLSTSDYFACRFLTCSEAMKVVGVVVNLLAYFKEPEPEINAKAPNSQSIMHPRKV